MAVEENKNSEVRKPVSYEDFDADDDDDVPLSRRLSQKTSKSRTCSSNSVDSVKKRPSALPVKRPLDNNNVLHTSIKRSKVSPYDDDDNGEVSLSRIIKRFGISADKSFFMKKKFVEKELELVEKSIQEFQRKRLVEEQRLQSLKRDIEECSKQLVAKEVQLCSMDDLIEVRKQKLISGQAKELESERKMLLKVMSIRKTDQHAQMKDFELIKKQFEARVKQHELKENHCEKQLKELESKEKHFKELESKVKQLEGRVKEFESKEEEFEGQMKELESKKKHFESRVKKLKSKKKHFESRVKKFKSKEKLFEDRAKEFESKKEELEDQMKDLESQRKHFENEVKEFKSKERQLEGRLQVLESKEKQLEGRLKKFDTKELELQGQAKEFQSREEEFEQVKEFKPEYKHFDRRAEVSESKEKQFEGQVKDIESKPNKLNSGDLKDLELKEKRYEALIKPLEEEKESDNQLLSSDQTDELEFAGDHILVDLLASSDPSKVILDIIQNPMIPRCRKGDSAVTIDRNHIVLLEQLMRISPAVNPHVREEALKLALDLKANMNENIENSSVVLGFLLLVSIYGLVSSFDKDELFKLFGFVAQHKIAIKLFRTMGFADKISDFVQNLMSKQQYVEAVTFICAYKLVDKYQLVDLL